MSGDTPVLHRMRELWNYLSGSFDGAERELKAIRKENTLLTYGVLACLKGMAEQGCNGPVREAIDKIEKSLNLRAHDQ